MVKTLLLAAALGALAAPAFAQTVAPTGSGASSNPPDSNQPNANPGISKPAKPSTSPGASSQAPGRQFQDLDTDRNGTVSEQEYGNLLGGPSQAYGAVDGNGDGRVTREEYANWLKTQPERTPPNGKTPGATRTTGDR